MPGAALPLGRFSNSHLLVLPFHLLLLLLLLLIFLAFVLFDAILPPNIGFMTSLGSPRLFRRNRFVLRLFGIEKFLFFTCATSFGAVIFSVEGCVLNSIMYSTWQQLLTIPTCALGVPPVV